MTIFKTFLSLTASSLAVSACVLSADGFTTPTGATDAGSIADSGMALLDATAPIGDATTAPEAGTPDTGTGSDGLPAHGPNLLTNGDFELGCAGWSGAGIALTQSSIARTGTSGCEVCVTAGSGTMIGQAVNNLTITVGQRYYVEVWIHGPATGTPAIEGPPSLTLNAVGPSGNNGAPAATGGIPNATWQRTNTLLTTSVTNNGLNFQMQFDGNTNGTCLVLDDAAIYLLD